MSKAPEENGFKPVQNADGSIRALAVPKFMKDPLWHLGYREDKYGVTWPINQPGVDWPDDKVPNEADELKMDTVVESSRTRAQNVIVADTVEFDPDKMVLFDNSGNRCELVRAKWVNYLCRIMCPRPLRSLVSWDEVYMEIMSVERKKDIPADPKGREKAKKMVRDTILRANKLFGESFNTSQKLFTWERGNVIRHL